MAVNESGADFGDGNKGGKVAKILIRAAMVLAAVLMPLWASGLNAALLGSAAAPVLYAANTGVGAAPQKVHPAGKEHPQRSGKGRSVPRAGQQEKAHYQVRLGKGGQRRGNSHHYSGTKQAPAPQSTAKNTGKNASENIGKKQGLNRSVKVQPQTGRSGEPNLDGNRRPVHEQKLHHPLQRSAGRRSEQGRERSSERNSERRRDRNTESRRDYGPEREHRRERSAGTSSERSSGRNVRGSSIRDERHEEPNTSRSRERSSDRSAGGNSEPNSERNTDRNTERRSSPRSSNSERSSRRYSEQSGSSRGHERRSTNTDTGSRYRNRSRSSFNETESTEVSSSGR